MKCDSRERREHREVRKLLENSLPFLDESLMPERCSRCSVAVGGAVRALNVCQREGEGEGYEGWARVQAGKWHEGGSRHWLGRPLPGVVGHILLLVSSYDLRLVRHVWNASSIDLRLFLPCGMLPVACVSVRCVARHTREL